MLNKKNILYVYDIEKWALHNVGLYWQSLVKDKFAFTFSRFGDHFKYNPNDFDYIFWGCSFMAEKYAEQIKHIFVKRKYPMWDPTRNSNFITVIHDPCEVFPEKKNWKRLKPKRLRKIKTFQKLGVISNEMHEIMAKLGFNTILLNTNSTIPLKQESEIKHEPLRIFSRARKIKRKNLALFSKIKHSCNSLCDLFDGYFNDEILDPLNYIELIDKYNCYICTSWQEGGPLPLMDAMRRGCAALTTPVGQTDQLIKNNYNGFICHNYDDFIKKINLLSESPDLLLRFRLNTLDLIAKNRDHDIRRSLLNFLS